MKDKDTKVDMSPEAIKKRLQKAAELHRLYKKIQTASRVEEGEGSGDGDPQ